LAEVIDKTKWIYFPQLGSSDELEKYFEHRTVGHSYFFHYTSLKAINEILRTKTLRISSVDRFNDEKDKKQFGDNKKEQKKYYSICFSSGQNENLSLWYLYSGLNGKGGRIGFTRNKLFQMISEGDFFWAEYDYDNNKIMGEEILLSPKDDIDISFRDVLYSKLTAKGDKKDESDANWRVDLKYNTMTNHEKIKKSEFETYANKHNGFNKSLVWYYEKETRLLIKLKGDLADKINPDKCYAVLWKLSQRQIDAMKIMFAPEIENFLEVTRYEYINDFMLRNSRTMLSENAGDISMKLCYKCEKNKEENKRKNEK